MKFYFLHVKSNEVGTTLKHPETINGKRVANPETINGNVKI
jgi:hypothetical protein